MNQKCWRKMWKNKSLPNLKTANVLSLWMRRKNAAKSLGELQEAETSGWLLTIWDMHALPIHTFSSNQQFSSTRYFFSTSFSPQTQTVPQPACFSSKSKFPQTDTFPQPDRLFPPQLLLDLHQHPSSATMFSSMSDNFFFGNSISNSPLLSNWIELTEQTGCWLLMVRWQLSGDTWRKELTTGLHPGKEQVQATTWSKTAQNSD